MLRLAFWSLLTLNAVLFVVAQGYLGNAKVVEHEPERLERQFNTNRITLLAHDGVKAASPAVSEPAPAARPAPAPEAQPDVQPDVQPEVAPEAKPEAKPQAAAAKPAAPAYACVEAGPFSEAAASRVETRLAALDLGKRQTRREVQSQEVHSWLVSIPPQASKEAAERKVAELRELGISDMYIMPNDSPMKWGISLGMFKTEAGAQAMMEKMARLGVRSARLTARGPQTTQYIYRFRDIDEAARARIATVAGRYASATVGNCGAQR